MSAYTETEIWYNAAPRKGDYRNCQPVIWEIGRKDSGFKYIVPVGTTFNVSIPKPLTWLFNPHDPRFMKAACLHDHMLKNGWDRTTAGGIFNDALRAEGVSKIKRMAMFTAVSLYKWE